MSPKPIREENPGRVKFDGNQERETTPTPSLRRQATPSRNENETSDQSSPRSDSDNQSNSSAMSEESFTMRNRQNAINTAHPFGIRLWKPALYRKKRSVEQNAEEDIHSSPNRSVPAFVRLGNWIWTLTFGLVMFITLILIWVPIFAISPFSSSARRYSHLLRQLAFFFLVPFGKYVQLIYSANYRDEDDGHGRPVADYLAWEQSAEDGEQPSRLFFAPRRRRPSQHFPRRNSNIGASTRGEAIDASSTSSDAEEELATNPYVSRLRLFGRGRWSIARLIYFLGYYFILVPVSIVVGGLCWLGVVGVPMARVIAHMLYHMRIHPLALKVRSTKSFSDIEARNPDAFSIVLCTYRAFGAKYYKYTVDGTNIMLLNMLFVVFVTIIDAMMVGFLPQGMHFVLSCVSIIPLAHFIGQAVASISAQSSMSMGATINAFFSTIVEVYLYLVALGQGKGELVEGSITGSVLAGVLLLPGLSMCTGAFKQKTQRFNPRSAGATSTMLLYTVIGVIGPTIFYSLYGPSQVQCTNRDGSHHSKKGEFSPAKICWSSHMKLRSDDVTYQKIIKPFGELCAVALFITYAIGLLFTLRTHAALIWSSQNAGPANEESRGEQAVNETANIPLLVELGLNEQGQQQEQGDSSQSQQGPSGQTEPGAPIGGGGDTPVQATQTQHSTSEQQTGGEEHEEATWGRTKSYVILLSATLLYAMIAEVLVDSVDVVLSKVNISQRMLGLTVFALVPNTTEFLNAISFALYGNVSLSLEIGSAYALQVCLLQIPALVLASQRNVTEHLGENLRDYVFVLLFPKWDTWAWIVSMLLYCHVHSEGRSNYFKGSILILAYLVIIIGFYFNDIINLLVPDGHAELFNNQLAAFSQSLLI